MTIANPKAARKLGIGMVFQHFSLFEALTVLENIALGMDAKIPARELEGRIREVMTALRAEARSAPRWCRPSSVGERQRIEIVRALLLNPKLLIMDEPTSVLTPQEVEQLFVVLRQLASEGCSILYISHKLHEIKALCDTATILRGGKLVDTCDPKVETSRSMAEKMIGAGLKDIQQAGRARRFGAEKLVVNHLIVPADRPFRHRRSRTSASRCGRARSSASPGSPATARTRCCWRCRGEEPADDADAITHRWRSRSARCSAPSARGSRAWRACPRSATAMRRCPISRCRDNSVLTARDRLGMVRCRADPIRARPGPMPAR